ncbi:MAG: hypothetical protein ACYTF6_11670 [Planctomycetota bacterium]|jgi:hypothetical protein
MARRTFVLWLLLLTACGGCRLVRYIGYLLAPARRTRTEKAAFSDLPGHSVAVVMYCGENIAYEYPYAQSGLSERIAAELEQRIKRVEVIDPERVLKYQYENIYWDSMRKTELGKALGAEYVLLVSLMQYTSREPNSVSLSRGRIVAEASVYQTSLPENKARVWRAPSVKAVFPADAPTGLLRGQARRILDETERQFVDALVKNFYDHKVEISQ